MKQTRKTHSSQRGISLIVSLVLLLLVTLISTSSLRGVLMQNRMSATNYDRSLAFQAAEAALREAETAAAAATSDTFPSSGCSQGLCATPALGSTPRWLDDAFAGWRTATAEAPSAAATPETVTEKMEDGANWFGCENEIPRQPNCHTPRYRVTSRSTSDERAAVIVQSDVASP
jgi:type IV pilus assembly protein PilX